MTPELLERIKRDFENEPRHSDWDSYLMGYLACLKRFGVNNVDIHLRDRSTYYGHDL